MLEKKHWAHVTGRPLNSLKNLLNISSSYPIIQRVGKFAPISTVHPPFIPRD